MEKKIDFEQALKRLEEIALKLEKGNLSLDESLKFFEEGIKLSRLCENKLIEVENKIKILTSSEMESNEEIEEKEEEKIEKKNKKKESIEEKNRENKEKKLKTNDEQGILPFQ